MADAKISQLPVATTPLDGTELVAVVQSSTTKQATVNNILTAGLPVSASTLAASGNVTLGDASTDTVQVNGYMGVGGAGDSAYGISVVANALTGTFQRGVRVSLTGTSAAVGTLFGVSTSVATAAAVHTVVDAGGIFLANMAKGAGSTITNQHGVYINDQTQGTNNFGVTSQVSSGANKWNIYASGTAANYFAGNVLLGTTTTTNNAPGGTTSTLVSVIKGDASFGGPMYTAYSGTTSANSRGNVHYYQRSRGTTDGDMTAVASGDALCRLVFRGSDGANFRAAASIEAFVDGAVTGGGADDMPGRLSFHTSVDGTSNITERLRIDSSGALIAKPAAGVGAVFNEDGVDADFRVESDTNTHALFVEGTNSNVKIGGSAERATTVGTNHLDIFDGTAPVGTLTNGISIYSSAGEAYVMDAAGNATLFSPHDAETNEWIFKSKHTPTGKVLKIDVERLLRFVNDHFGLDAVQEFIED